MIDFLLSTLNGCCDIANASQELLEAGVAALARVKPANIQYTLTRFILCRDLLRGRSLKKSLKTELQQLRPL